jgi:hypothetical protein
LTLNNMSSIVNNNGTKTKHNVREYRG